MIALFDLWLLHVFLSIEFGLALVVTAVLSIMGPILIVTKEMAEANLCLMILWKASLVVGLVNFGVACVTWLLISAWLVFGCWMVIMIQPGLSCAVPALRYVGPKHTWAGISSLLFLGVFCVYYPFVGAYLHVIFWGEGAFNETFDSSRFARFPFPVRIFLLFWCLFVPLAFLVHYSFLFLECGLALEVVAVSSAALTVAFAVTREWHQFHTKTDTRARCH